jgi:hypothetical protein
VSIVVNAPAQYQALPSVYQRSVFALALLTAWLCAKPVIWMAVLAATPPMLGFCVLGSERLLAPALASTRRTVGAGGTTTGFRSARLCVLGSVNPPLQNQFPLIAPWNHTSFPLTFSPCRQPSKFPTTPARTPLPSTTGCARSGVLRAFAPSGDTAIRCIGPATAWPSPSIVLPLIHSIHPRTGFPETLARMASIEAVPILPEACPG